MPVEGEMDMAETKTSQETATGTVMLVEGEVDMAETTPGLGTGGHGSPAKGAEGGGKTAKTKNSHMHNPAQG